MRMLPAVLTCIAVLACVLAEPTQAAIKFKRFPACPDGPVSMKTCECQAAGTSRRHHFCHAGNSCDTATGQCHK
jgi:hypothetical protein